MKKILVATIAVLLGAGSFLMFTGVSGVEGSSGRGGDDDRRTRIESHDRFDGFFGFKKRLNDDDGFRFDKRRIDDRKHFDDRDFRFAQSRIDDRRHFDDRDFRFDVRDESDFRNFFLEKRFHTEGFIDRDRDAVMRFIFHQ